MAQQSINDDDRVTEFVEFARKYCELIESHERLTLHEFIGQCAVLIGHLFGAGAALVDVVCELPGGFCHEGLAHEQSQELRDKLAEKLGTHNRYWVVFDPYDKESVCSYGLGGDLAEIYRDLLRPLHIYGNSEQENRAAVSDWRFHFLIHWGRHCTHALVAINC
ncbi:MAG: DUF5063 domain-containing protein, partial [Planctomycetes bacterium]|nr:DUF5063 domain-containing protein [Planctomycetota bacterium]